MAATKKIKAESDTGLTLYVVVQRQADDFFLDDADGTFSASPADFYLSLTEHSTVKGLYSVSESRTVWDDGTYLIMAYQQSGGSPSIASDFTLGQEKIQIKDDIIVEQSGDSFAIVNHSTYGNAKLVRSTTPANTLDVSSTGEAGLDFNNIKDATIAHTLTNIRVPSVTLTDTITNYTGNTVQTGDSFARLGVPTLASVSADIAARPTLAEILAGGDIDGYTIEQAQKLILAALVGVLTGAGTATIQISAADGSKVRITGTVDGNGNRSGVTLDATG